MDSNPIDKGEDNVMIQENLNLDVPLNRIDIIKYKTKDQTEERY